MRCSAAARRATAASCCKRRLARRLGSLSWMSAIKSPARTTWFSTTYTCRTRPSTGASILTRRSSGLNAITRPVPRTDCCHGMMNAANTRNNAPTARPRARIRVPRVLPASASAGSGGGIRSGVVDRWASCMRRNLRSEFDNAGAARGNTRIMRDDNNGPWVGRIDQCPGQLVKRALVTFEHLIKEQ